MEHQALERIIQLANAGPVPVQEGGVLVPQGMTLESMERFADKPRFHKVKFQAETMDSFAQYLAVANDHMDDEGAHPTIYVSKEEIHAVLDHGSPVSPRWMHHRATLPVKYEPEFSALLRICPATRNTPVTKRELIEFIEEWDDVVHLANEINEEEIVPTSKAIATIRKAKVREKSESLSIEDHGITSHSAMANCELTSSGGTVPRFIVVRSTVFEGAEDFLPVYCRLSPHKGTNPETQAEDVVFKIRIMRFQEILDLATESLRFRVEQRAPEGFTVFSGTTI